MTTPDQILFMTTLKATNEKRWIACHVHESTLLTIVAQKLLANKSRYEMVAAATKVPWPLIAVIHEREASGSWLANISNGDPWDKPTIHVPRGRGPFLSWEAAAEDALMNCPPRAGANTDWSMGGALVLLEEYNGLGYAERGLPSPYLWAGTDQYLKGKYIADGHYDPDVVDTQLGCAAILKEMQKFDTTVQE